MEISGNNTAHRFIYEPGSRVRARVRRIPAFLWAAFTTYVTILYFQCVVNYFFQKTNGVFITRNREEAPLWTFLCHKRASSACFTSSRPSTLLNPGAILSNIKAVRRPCIGHHSSRRAAVLICAEIIPFPANLVPACIHMAPEAVILCMQIVPVILPLEPAVFHPAVFIEVIPV